jgi:replicative DNA helicase
LHIQKFEEWDDNDGFKPQGGNWKPLGPSPTPGSGSGDEAGGKFFIQKGSRMNSGSFDEGLKKKPRFDCRLQILDFLIPALFFMVSSLASQSL